MPIFYHPAMWVVPSPSDTRGERPGLAGCEESRQVRNPVRVPPSTMERVFDPDIWRDVTGGEVAERVRRLTRVTPLIPAPALGRRTGADVWLKLENLQRTGSFKLRGAAARIAALALHAGGDVKPRVIAASAGNHGLGIAL